MARMSMEQNRTCSNPPSCVTLTCAFSTLQSKKGVALVEARVAFVTWFVYRFCFPHEQVSVSCGDVVFL